MKKLFLVLAIFILVLKVYCQTAEECYYHGDNKYNFQDYKGAIVDFSQAIKINPSYK